MRTYFMWLHKLKRSSLLKFTLSATHEVTFSGNLKTKDFFVKGFCENFMLMFSTSYFIWDHCIQNFDALHFLRVHQIAEHRNFFWRYFVKTKLSTGCFIWGHCLGKSDWIFFLKTHQIVWRRDFFVKKFHKSFKIKVVKKYFVWGFHFVWWSSLSRDLIGFQDILVLWKYFLIRLDLLKAFFSSEVSIWPPPPSYFKKNYFNIDITLFTIV